MSTDDGRLWTAIAIAGLAGIGLARSRGSRAVRLADPRLAASNDPCREAERDTTIAVSYRHITADDQRWLTKYMRGNDMCPIYGGRLPYGWICLVDTDAGGDLELDSWREDVVRPSEALNQVFKFAARCGARWLIVSTDDDRTVSGLPVHQEQ